MNENECCPKFDPYLAVDKDIPSEEMMTLSGKFLCIVYEDPFQETEKWCKDFKQFSSNKG